MYRDQGWDSEDEGMINLRRITQTISQTMGHLIGFAIFLCVAVCILLLMPGIALISWIDDLSLNQISTPMLWLGSLVISLGVYVLIRALIKDPDRSWKVYGGICAAALILCIFLSMGEQYHFGRRWVRRLMGLPVLSQVFLESKSAYMLKPIMVERSSINRRSISALDFPSSGASGCQSL